MVVHGHSFHSIIDSIIKMVTTLLTEKSTKVWIQCLMWDIICDKSEVWRHVKIRFGYK